MSVYRRLQVQPVRTYPTLTTFLWWFGGNADWPKWRRVPLSVVSTFLSRCWGKMLCRDVCLISKIASPKPKPDFGSRIYDLDPIWGAKSKWLAAKERAYCYEYWLPREMKVCWEWLSFIFNLLCIPVFISASRGFCSVVWCRRPMGHTSMRPSV